MFFIKNKKGMSPLLVTIFLTALAVSLGAMVVSWGSNNDQGRDSSSCDDVSISPQIVSGNEMLCFNESSGKLKIMIINDGNVPLEGIMHRQINSDFAVNEKMIPTSKLAVGQVMNTEILLNSGKIRAELIPVITVLNENILCSGKAIIRENISSC